MSLAELASDLCQQASLVLRLDAFRYYPHVKLARYLDQAFHNCEAWITLDKPAYKGLVNFDDIDGNGQKMGKRCESGAEIIQRDAQAMGAQGFEFARDQRIAFS